MEKNENLTPVPAAYRMPSVPVMSAREYTELKKYSEQFTELRAIGVFARVGVFVTSFFAVMYIQQKRLKKYLPHRITHRYFLVAPLTTGLIAQYLVEKRRMRQLQHCYLLSQGYLIEDGVVKKKDPSQGNVAVS